MTVNQVKMWQYDLCSYRQEEVFEECKVCGGCKIECCKCDVMKKQNIGKKLLLDLIKSQGDDTV